MSRDRRSRLRFLWLCPWCGLLATLAFVGYVLSPAIEQRSHTSRWKPLDVGMLVVELSLPLPELPWYIYIAVGALLLTVLNLGLYTLAHGFSPSSRHQIEVRSLWRGKQTDVSPFWANILVAAAVLAGSYYAAGKWPTTAFWIFGALTSLLLIWHIGFAYSLHSEGEGFARAEERRSREMREADRRVAIARQQQEEVEARQLARQTYEQQTLDFEDMRRTLLQLYLANINTLERTYWSAEFIRAFFAQAEKCYHERWQEVQAAYECHCYDLQLHAKVWRIAHLYEKFAHIIGDRLSKADLWLMLDSIQQTNDRKKPMQTIVEECDELSESLRLLCEQSQDSWLHRHDDDTARRYEELLELPVAQPRSAPSSPSLDAQPRPVPPSGLARGAGASLIPPVRIMSDGK